MHGLYYEIKCLDSHPSLNVFSLVFSYYFFVFTWLYYLNIHSRGPHNVQNKDKLLVDLFFFMVVVIVLDILIHTCTNTTIQGLYARFKPFMFQIIFVMPLSISSWLQARMLMLYLFGFRPLPSVNYLIKGSRATLILTKYM
jgi:hypothetical protein